MSLGARPIAYRPVYRLSSLLEAERNKARREEALNLLEGYLYRLRDLLDGDSSSSFEEFVQPDERLQLAQGLERSLAWLNEAAHTADAVTLRKMRDDLEYVMASRSHRPFLKTCS